MIWLDFFINQTIYTSKERWDVGDPSWLYDDRIITIDLAQI